MTAIYSITNLENGKRYIGKSKNPEKRWCQHKRNLSKEVINKKQTNPHLFKG